MLVAVAAAAESPARRAPPRKRSAKVQAPPPAEEDDNAAQAAAAAEAAATSEGRVVPRLKPGKFLDKGNNTVFNAALKYAYLPLPCGSPLHLSFT